MTSSWTVTETLSSTNFKPIPPCSSGYRRREAHNQISGETMSEVTDLVVIEKSSAMAVFTTKEQLDPII
ncbi:hypothetical protein ABKU20_24460, partial [Enterobacter asburiae]